MKMVRTWVLVADAKRARLLELRGGAGGLKPVKDMDFETELPRTHELVDDRQPRSFESVGSARHAIGGRADPHREKKRHFSAAIAQILNERLEGHAYEKLVVIAPPQAPGALREYFTPAVRAVISHEVAKDFTKTPNSEILDHLKSMLPL